MHYIYVLTSEKDGKLYVGCTSNVENRLKYHNSGRVLSTKGRRPFRLIFTETYSDKYQAFEKERYYKTAKGKKELKAKMEKS